MIKVVALLKGLWRWLNPACPVCHGVNSKQCQTCADFQTYQP